MKLTSFKWMAAGLMLSTVYVGASTINNGAPTATSGTTINWKDRAIDTKESDQHVASHNYAKSLSGAFRGASEKVMPSVVTIQSISSKPQDMGQQGQLPEEFRDNPLFKRFFEGMDRSSILTVK